MIVRMQERESRDVQATPSPALSPTHLSSLGSFYRTRRDVLEQRSLLEASLPDFREYMRILALFLHGMCGRDRFEEMVQVQLTSDNLTHLHNEFLRAILHNAHFSMVSPPNVTIVKRPRPPPPSRAPPLPRRRDGDRPLQLVTAIDLRHLPTRRELAERLRRIPKTHLDDAAVEVLCMAVRQFTQKLLRSASQLQPRGLSARDRPRVSIAQLLFACQHSGMDRVMSPSVITKYSLVRDR